MSFGGRDARIATSSGCSAKSQRTVVRGGDLDGELDEIEIDDRISWLVKGSGSRWLPAATSVHAMDADVEKALREAGGEIVFLPFWTRQHWSLLVVHNMTARFFDSAPSPAVWSDVVKYTKRIGVREVAKCVGPQQIRGSAECGVFVLGFVVGLLNNRRFSTGKVSLANVRPLLKERIAPKVEWFNNMYATLNGAGNRDWVLAHDEEEVAAMRLCLCYLLTATIMVNAVHEEIGAEVLDWSTRALQIRARRLGFSPNTHHDMGDALNCLNDKGVFMAQYRLASEIDLQDPKLPSPILIQWPSLAEAEKADLSGWTVKLAARFSGNVDVHQGTGLARAMSGHYQIREGRGEYMVLVRSEANSQPKRTQNKKPSVPTQGSLKQAVRTLGEAERPRPNKKKGKKPAQDVMKSKPPAATEVARPVTKNIPAVHKTFRELAPYPGANDTDDDEDIDHSPKERWNKSEWINQEEMELLKSRAKAPAGTLKGSWLMLTKIFRSKPPHIHRLVWHQYAESTRKKQIEWLLTLKAMPADLVSLPFANAVVELVLRLANERKWAWSTVSAVFSAIHSAVKSLPVYTNLTSGYDLKETPVFNAAMQRVQKLAKVAGPDSQLSLPMTFETMQKILRKCHNLGTRTLLAVSGYFAARVGDLRQVFPKDVVLPANGDENGVTTITFKLGKGGACWGPFTIASVLPQDVAKDVASLLAQRDLAKSLWTEGEQRSLSSLVSDHGLCLRSIRRGALLWNADKGVDDHQLQLLSGHKRMDTLMRYLGWGKASSSAKKAAAERHVLTAGEAPFTTEPKKMGNHAGYQGVKGRRIARPPGFFWHRPPTRAHLGLDEAWDLEEYPLHIKEVDPLDIEAVRDMAAGSIFEKDWEMAVRWLKGEPYEALEGTRLPDTLKIPRAAFKEEQIRELLKARKIEPLRGEGKSWTNMFPHVERAKKVIRVLGEPAINRHIRVKEHYPELEYRSRKERREQVLGSLYACEFDYKTYFDQFWLDDVARNYHVVRTVSVDGGEYFRLTRLPMGARFSPSIAQLTTWVICEPLTKIPGVRVSTMIDNVRIVADNREGFVKAVRLFLERSGRAKMSLNAEADAFRTTDDGIAALGALRVSSGYDFLGEHYTVETDADGKRLYCIANTEKLVNKLAEALEYFAEYTPTLRQLAALIGLMLYMAHTINIELAHHHTLLRAYAQLFKGCPEWDEPTTAMSETLSCAIRGLGAMLMANQRVVIGKAPAPSMDVRDYDAVVIFDACQNAWAAKVFFPKEALGYRVMKAFRMPLKHSAHAEPTAAKELLRWMKVEFPAAKKIALVTDHLALAKGQRRWWSGNAGFSTAFHLNEAFKEINGTAEVFHVEGEANICDEDSRSAQAAAARFIRVEKMQELVPDLTGFDHPYKERQPVKGF